MTLDQERLELEIRRVGLDVQRLDATMQLLGTSVRMLGENVQRLGTFVRQLETRLDLGRRIIDHHQHTIMTHLRVPPAETFHSALPDQPSEDDRASGTPEEGSGTPGEVGG